MPLWKNASKLKKTGIVTAGFLLSLVILVVIIGIFAPAPEETTQASDPTATSPPTLPPPIDTPVPDVPTATSPPTLSPPTDTPVPDDCSSSASQIYLGKLGQVSTGIGIALDDFQELNTLAGISTLLIVNDDWKLQVVVVLATLNAYADELEALHPPPILQPLRSQVAWLASEIRTFTTMYARGIDNLDPTLIDLATQPMAAVGDIAVSMTATVESICG